MARNGRADGLFGGRFHGNDERQISPIGIGQLKNRIDGNALGRKCGGELRDDAGSILHAEAQIIG